MMLLSSFSLLAYDESEVARVIEVTRSYPSFITPEQIQQAIEDLEKDDYTLIPKTEAHFLIEEKEYETLGYLEDELRKNYLDDVKQIYESHCAYDTENFLIGVTCKVYFK